MTARLFFPLRLLLGLTLLVAAGCAEVTRPRPTAPEEEAVQLDAVRRHPHQSWSMDRASRVFLKLLATLPRIHGRTYPFLGFSWWVTATGKVAVDHVWRPSPAADAGLKQGDLILAVNNWPLPTWTKDWDEAIRGTRSVFHELFVFVPTARPAPGGASLTPLPRVIFAKVHPSPQGIGATAREI